MIVHTHFELHLSLLIVSGVHYDNQCALKRDNRLYKNILKSSGIHSTMKLKMNSNTMRPNKVNLK